MHARGKNFLQRLAGRVDIDIADVKLAVGGGVSPRLVDGNRNFASINKLAICALYRILSECCYPQLIKHMFEKLQREKLPAH